MHKISKRSVSSLLRNDIVRYRMPAAPLSALNLSNLSVSRLMDLIVNSLYSNKEVFLRELISVTNSELIKDEVDLDIRIQANKDNGIITITNSGIGMTSEELIDCLVNNREVDYAWDHGTKQEKGTRTYAVCNYCSHPVSGITRLKYHLANVKGIIKICQRVPPAVKEGFRDNFIADPNDPTLLILKNQNRVPVPENRPSNEENQQQASSSQRARPRCSGKMEILEERVRKLEEAIGELKEERKKQTTTISPPLNHQSLAAKRRRHLPLPAVIKNQFSVIDGPASSAVGNPDEANYDRYYKVLDMIMRFAGCNWRMRASSSQIARPRCSGKMAVLEEKLRKLEQLKEEVKKLKNAS
ncbi:hypothetical protein AgCh_029666 [Apium graveolens]